MNSRILMITCCAITALIIGCGDSGCQKDPAMRRKMYLKCIEQAPEEALKKDYAEIVDKCANKSYYMATVCK